jgi:AsmA protein
MKRILKILAIIAAVLIVIAVAIPFFVDANTFRPKLETELTAALGREVKLGNLSLSIFSGSVSADDISIADDPQFSKSAFVQAKSLKVGVKLMPLIFSKTLNVTQLTLKQPEISLVKSEDGAKWNFSSLGGNNKSAPKPATNAPGGGNPNLSVAKLNISEGRLTVSRAGSGDTSANKPKVYDKVDIEVINFSFTSSFPFKVTVQLPADGSLKLEGNAGPIDADNAAATPLSARITLKNMNLAASGFIDPAAGIAGIADFDGSVTSDGHEAKTQGKLTVADLQVVQKGSPAGRPVEVTYTLVHDLRKETGSIPQCEIAMGKAVAHVSGTYDAHGKVTAVDLKLDAQAMPVDDLEAMLPALGVILPPKSTLKGGDLSTTMTIVGPVNELVTTGTIRLENSSLSNFDLGAKMSSISALAGKKTGNDLVIQNFSSDVRVAPEGTTADNINLNVPSLGVVTGAGTVSPANELAFKMSASLAGMSMPFSVKGTTADPKFVPDVEGMAKGLLKGLGSTSEKPASGVIGLFKKKPQ